MPLRPYAIIIAIRTTGIIVSLAGVAWTARRDARTATAIADTAMIQVEQWRGLAGRWQLIAGLWEKKATVSCGGGTEIRMVKP